MKYNQYFSFNNDDGTILDSGLVKIRGKILICGNIVYQIKNIASIGLVDLTTTKKMPTYYWFLLALGLVFVINEGLQNKIIGFLILSLCAWLFYDYNLNKIREKYGMTIYTNSGTKKIIVSKSKDFIIKVIVTLSQIMDGEQDKYINFNFDTLDMSDRSVEIGYNSGSPIVSGQVGRDIVNSIN